MLGVVGAGVFYCTTIDNTVRAKVEQMIADHYKHLRVSVRSAALLSDGIQVRGVTITDPNADGPQSELAHFEELFLSCKTDLKTLLTAPPEIKEVTVRRPTIRSTHRPDGAWSASRLFPLPKFGAEPPTILIEGGSLELFDPLKLPAVTFTVRDAYFKVVAADPKDVPVGERAPLVVSGYCSADSIRRVNVEGTFATTGGALELRGEVEGLEVAPELTHALPGDILQRAKLLESLRGQANGRFSVRYDSAAEQPWDYQVSGQLNRGRLDDSRLPHALTDMKAGFRCSPGGLAIENLTANAGAATIELNLTRSGLGEDSPMAIVAKARRLKLDQQLAEILPEKMRDQWKEFMPAGELDLDANVRFDGKNWTPDVTVTCHDVAFTYPKFPYRLEHGAGRITLKDDVLIVGMTAFGGVEEVHLDGKIVQPTGEWTGYFQVQGKNLPADQKLTRALPAKPREIVENLNAHGTFNLWVRYWRDPGQPMHNRLWIELNRCDIRFKDFPYPLSNIRGIAEATDNVWDLHDLEGTNDSGKVKLRGAMVPDANGEGTLTLEIVGDNIPLEDELRDALKPSAAQLWNEVRPSGAVNVHVKVVHRSDLKEPKIELTAWPVQDSVAILPTYFPYRMEKVHGVFAYKDGQIEMHDLRAVHGADTKVTAHGKCTVDANGGWRLALDNLYCGRLTPDRDLIVALPPRLRKAVTDMQVAGPISATGSLTLASNGKPGEPLHADWDVTCDLQQVRMGYSFPLENINGKMRLVGRFDGKRFGSSGELNLHSLTYKKFQFTDVCGPIWIDDERVLLGANVNPPAGEKPRQITSRSCGGAILVDAWVMLGGAPHWNLDATVVRAQLAKLAQEVVAGRQKLSGDISARVNIQREGAAISQLRGWGNVQLRNADVYELPPMASMLKLLSIRAPDTSAFSKGDVDFVLAGDRVYFKRIDFNGDAISLRGTGQMGLDKTLQLTFYTVVGRDEFRVPLISNVLGGASQQLMAINVDGPVDSPNIRKQALPALNEAMQQLQAELQAMSGPTAQKPAGAPTGTGLAPAVGSRR